MFVIVRSLLSFPGNTISTVDIGGFYTTTLQETIMKEITSTELVTDTVHHFFYGGMTAEENVEEPLEEEKLEDLHVYLARHKAEIVARPSSPR